MWLLLGPQPSELSQLEAKDRASRPSIRSLPIEQPQKRVQVGGVGRWVGGSPGLGAAASEGHSSEPICPAAGWVCWL